MPREQRRFYAKLVLKTRVICALCRKKFKNYFRFDIVHNISSFRYFRWAGFFPDGVSGHRHVILLTQCTRLTEVHIRHQQDSILIIGDHLEHVKHAMRNNEDAHRSS